MGKRQGDLYFDTLPKDHPHACGEKYTPKMLADELEGSSPRMWGKVDGEPYFVGKDGIIPTHVGKRNFLKIRKDRKKDHPHACGEKPVCTVMSAAVAGSSPRMWGKALTCSQPAGSQGIIPTHVGKRLKDPEIRCLKN